ncbi:MAG: hypothetical protein IMY77_02870, partial [Chloroflexi bacterium]|nr:hypothetical protein [Chloroflexota bacterium]
MKTKRISKLLGWGLSIAVVLSLGLAALPVGAQGEMEWAEVATPSWEDEVIAPGSEIYDYAIGSDDGDIVYALGAVVGGHDATNFADASLNTCGDHNNAIGLSGSFAIASGSLTVTAVSDDVAEITGDFDGTACYLDGDFTAVLDMFVDLNPGGVLSNGDFVGEGAVSGEITYGTASSGADEMVFSGRLYRDTGNTTSPPAVGNTAHIIALGSPYPVSGTTICVDEWQIEAFHDGDLYVTWGMFTEPRAWQSDDGGVTWSDITATVQEANNLPGPFFQFMYGGVDVAPDDEDWLVVAGGIYLPPCDYDLTSYFFGNYPDYNGAPAVVASQDGAGEFTYAGDMADTTNGTTMERIYDVAVSPEMDDIHNIAIAGFADDGACFTGANAGTIFRLEAGTWLSGNWEDTSFYDGWDSGIVDNGLLDPEFSDCVVAVDFSPNFDLDVSILFMSTALDVNPGGDPLPYLQSGIWESGGTWNDEADFSTAVQITDNGVELWCEYGLRMMGFALPADYDGSDPGARNLYLYVDAYQTVSEATVGVVVMVEDDSLSWRCGPSGDPLLASIAVYGDADSCKAMVGRYIDWENVSGPLEGDPIPWDCCEGVPVWHTVELDYCCPDWDGACKDPSGP